jgi:hypothetical protein
MGRHRSARLPHALPFVKALSFEFEYAMEDNGNLRDSTAWNGLVAWQFEGRRGNRRFVPLRGLRRR